MNFAALVSQATTSTIQAPSTQDWADTKKRMTHHTDAMLDLLRAELVDLTGAPCSPSMSAIDLHKSIVRCRTTATEPKTVGEIIADHTKVKPSKPQGIGAHIVFCLKGGMSPKDTLASVQSQFEGTATSMACVYWYKSKINTGAI